MAALRAAAKGVVRAPVLIVGGGPVGLYSSALLSAYGVPSVLVERRKTGSHHPRAHLVNTRSMELLRELGVAAAMREQSPPLDEWREFRYCTSLLGQSIAVQDHAAGPAWADLSAATPSPMTHLSQPKLESILRAEAERRAGAVDATMLFGYECASFEQHEHGVRAELRPSGADAARKRGSGEEDGAPPPLVVEARTMLACDGAHSPTRRALGIALRGPPPLQHFKSVHFVAPALAEAAAASPAMLYFVFNPAAVCVFVAHNIQRGEWVAQLPFFPGLQEGDRLDAAACAQTIAACIGADVPFEVRSATSWAMSAKVRMHCRWRWHGDCIVGLHELRGGFSRAGHRPRLDRSPPSSPQAASRMSVRPPYVTARNGV